MRRLAPCPRRTAGASAGWLPAPAAPAASKSCSAAQPPTCTSRSACMPLPPPSPCQAGMRASTAATPSRPLLAQVPVQRTRVVPLLLARPQHACLCQHVRKAEWAAGGMAGRCCRCGWCGQYAEQAVRAALPAGRCTISASSCSQAKHRAPGACAMSSGQRQSSHPCQSPRLVGCRGT